MQKSKQQKKPEVRKHMMITGKIFQNLKLELEKKITCKLLFSLRNKFLSLVYSLFLMLFIVGRLVIRHEIVPKDLTHNLGEIVGLKACLNTILNKPTQCDYVTYMAWCVLNTRI